MKHIVILSLFLVLVPAPAAAADRAPYWYEAGTVMTWGVDSFGERYDFVVTIRKLGREIEFDWRMTEPANRSGSVKMTEIALAAATKQHNRFKGGSLTLADKTTVWVSRAVLKQYRDEKTVHRIDTGSGPRFFVPEEDDTRYKLDVDGREIVYEVLHLKSGGEHLWVLDNLAAPLIFKMDLGWKIRLKSVKTR